MGYASCKRASRSRAQRPAAPDRRADRREPGGGGNPPPRLSAGGRPSCSRASSIALFRWCAPVRHKRADAVSLPRTHWETVRHLVELRSIRGILGAPWRYRDVPRSLCISAEFGIGVRSRGQPRSVSFPKLKCWRTTVAPYHVAARFTRKIHAKPGWRHSTWACTGAAVGNQYGPTGKIGFIIRFTVASACITGGRQGRAISRDDCGGRHPLELAAVIPLPEGMPELLRTGALAARVHLVRQREGPALAEADSASRPV